MSLPMDLKYLKSHEWVKFEPNGNVKIGLTDYAQESLSDVVFVNLCMAGDSFKVGESLGDVESIKAISEVYSPIDGTVEYINDEVIDSPEMINTAPYETWLVELSGVTDNGELLTPEEYEAYLQTL